MSKFVHESLFLKPQFDAGVLVAPADTNPGDTIFDCGEAEVVVTGLDCVVEARNHMAWCNEAGVGETLQAG